MNVNCIICSDLLTPISEIYTTPCGHLFHHICLIQWLERSKTCPQCRNKATDKTSHRVYLNLANTDGIVDDVGTLQSKLDNLQFQMNSKDREVKISKDKYNNAKIQISNLRDEIKELEHKSKVSESGINALKEQISYFKLKAKECDRMGDEIIRLKEKLKELENVQTVLNGSKEQVNDMLRHNRDPHSLSILVSTLKKELMETDRKYKQASSNLKHLQNSTACHRKEILEMRQENERLKNDVEVRKHSEKERRYLKEKLCELESEPGTMSCSSVTSNLKRILTESPAPLSKRPFLKDSSSLIGLDETISPSINDRVKRIMESDSPYLPIKSSNIGLPSFLKSKYTTLKHSTSRSAPNNHILNHSQKMDPKLPSEEYSYDGFGGHSKTSQFPSPKLLSRRKRSKSSSVSSIKFRKLAPNKTLMEFRYKD